MEESPGKEAGKNPTPNQEVCMMKRVKSKD
jgi:hypothetical protein